MRIAYVSEMFYPKLPGGGERQFYEIARRVARKHDVDVYTLNHGIGRTEHEGMNIISVGLRSPPKGRDVLVRGMSILSAFPNLGKYDIVHLNQGYSLFLSLFHKNPVLTFHDIYFSKWSSFGPLGIPGRIMEKLTTMMRGQIVAVSRQTWMKLATSGVKPSRMRIIPNGIDMKKYRKRRKEKTILYVGRLVNYKRVEELIRAHARLSNEGYDYRLKIIGDGPERERLEAMAGDGVEFLGFVSEERKIEELSRAEIFANPSVVEGFGISVLEAMASGCKVVVKPLLCYDFVPDEWKWDVIYDGILHAISSGKPKYIISRYDWDSIVKDYLELYESMLE